VRRGSGSRSRSRTSDGGAMNDRDIVIAVMLATFVIAFVVIYAWLS
jgi:hypothetical protein